MMDLIILKKRLSTFRNDEGRLSNVSDELLLDILRSWESWTGKAKELYEGLGLSKQQMAILIKKAKRITRDGAKSEFKEISLESVLGPAPGAIVAIEVTWDSGKIIRFPNVDQLIDFLKKVA
jgi:hypothetical protein